MRPDYIQCELLNDEEVKLVTDTVDKRLETAFVTEEKITSEGKTEKPNFAKKMWSKRRGKICFIDESEHFEVLAPVVQKVVECFKQGAHKEWGVELPFVEYIQYTHYGLLDVYGWHMDVGLSGPHRLVSASVDLDDPKSYIGGGVQFYHHPNPKPNVKKGTMNIFPSYMMHRANTVFYGKRRSLVIWGGF